MGRRRPFGRLPATQSMRFDIVLPLRDKAGLESFLQELYDPSSPSYRHFLTVQEFTERFGPSQEDYDAMVRFAKANGFTVIGGSRDAMDVQLKGSVANVETAFHVTMDALSDPTRTATSMLRTASPRVDLPFQVWHVSGLDNYSIPRPAFERRDLANQKSPATTGSCPAALLLRQRHAGGLLRGNGSDRHRPERWLAGVCRI